MFLEKLNARQVIMNKLRYQMKAITCMLFASADYIAVQSNTLAQSYAKPAHYATLPRRRARRRQRLSGAAAIASNTCAFTKPSRRFMALMTS
eukprot:6196158-Pleurochrysis_carterae.AAC.3